MTSDAFKSLLIKLSVMALTAVASYLHITLGAADTNALAVDFADGFMLLYGYIRSHNMKLVPHDAKVLSVLLALVLAVTLFGGNAFAADNIPVIKAATVAPVTPSCTAQNCSGWYAGFGIAGDGSNVDIVGNGINGSVFSSGGILKAQGGYQLWSGVWFAALDVSAGYEFTTASSGLVNSGGSRFVGTELIKLGYNFFPQAANATTTPSQSPVPLSVPANLLASTTPYFNFGGMQRRGISEWVNGVGLQTVIAAGWSSDVQYLYAPSQQGVPATSIVMLGLNKHF